MGGGTKTCVYYCKSSLRVSVGAGLLFFASAPAFSTIDNTVTVTGTPPGGTATAYDTDTESVDVIDAVTDLVVDKTSNVANVSAAGDQIEYSVEVRNNGNVTLNTISVTDALITLVCPTNGDATITSLAPGASETCTATFTTTQTDFDMRGANDGSAEDNDIDNTVNVSSLDPQGGTVNGSDSHAVTMTIDQQISVVKTANLNDEVTPNGFAEVSETITYTFDVTNTGNVTLLDVRVDDTTNATNGPVVPGLEVVFNDVPPLTDSSDAAANGTWDSLAPGDTKRNYPKIFTMKGGSVSTVAIMTTLSATIPAHTAIDNSAVAVGTFAAADDTTSTPSTATVPVIAASRDLSIVKSVATGPTTAGGTDGTVTDAGDTITYLYIITNDGNVTETNVTPVDTGPTFGGTAPTSALSAFTEVAGGTGTAASLAPGETVHFNATYTFADVDVYRAATAGANSISNSATASSDGHVDADASVATASIPANPALSVSKAAVLNDEVNADLFAEVGETITYTYTVTNTGNVPITNVGIQDTHEGALLAPAPAGETITTEGPVQASNIGVANDGVIDQLEAGAVATFTYVHTVTQTEVDNQ